MGFYHRNRPQKSDWEKRKNMANAGDFPLIRGLIGHNATELIRAIMKLSFLLAIIAVIAASITNIKLKLLEYIFGAFLGIGLICLALMFVLAPIGLVYNYVGNVIHVFKRMRKWKKVPLTWQHADLKRNLARNSLRLCHNTSSPFPVGKPGTAAKS